MSDVADSDYLWMVQTKCNSTKQSKSMGIAWYDLISMSTNQFRENFGVRHHPIEQSSREIVEETISQALTPFHLVDDLYFLQNSFLVFIAQK
jgi:hypothetical protein